MQKREGRGGLGQISMRQGNGRTVPFPLDHFFFCFLPAVAAAGAYFTHRNYVRILDFFFMRKGIKTFAVKVEKTDHDC